MMVTDVMNLLKQRTTVLSGLRNKFDSSQYECTYIICRIDRNFNFNLHLPIFFAFLFYRNKKLFLKRKNKFANRKIFDMN